MSMIPIIILITFEFVIGLYIYEMYKGVGADLISCRMYDRAYSLFGLLGYMIFILVFALILGIIFD
jgi:hypothetical protein